MKGCNEIVDEIDIDFDFICCACGTGTTIAGIAQNFKSHQTAIGIAVLKYDKMEEEIREIFSIQHSSFHIQHYPFGGYAKTTPELIQFIKDFYEEEKIMLDYVYTGKMMYESYNLVSKNYFPENSTVIVVHTGGVMNANIFEL